MTLRTDECRISALKRGFFRAREASAAVSGFSANALESRHVSVQLPLVLVFAMSPFAVGEEGEVSAVVTTLGEVAAASSTTSK